MEKKTHFMYFGQIVWSRKFENCQICKKTDNKHVWVWLCMICYDRKRVKTKKVIERMKIYRQNYIIKNPEKRKESSKKYEEKRKEKKDIINCLRKWRRYKKQNKPCMIYKNRYIPIDITSRDPEVQKLWTRVKDYIDTSRHRIQI